MSDRKYRQRGYQDDGSRQERRDRSPGPRPERQGPRGRGLGAPTASVFRCAICGEKQSAPEGTDTGARCRKCATALHTCTHCQYFDTSAPKECRQEIPERIAGKAKANSCELFAPKVAAEFAADRDQPGDAKAAFDALFKL